MVLSMLYPWTVLCADSLTHLAFPLRNGERGILQAMVQGFLCLTKRGSSALQSHQFCILSRDAASFLKEKFQGIHHGRKSAASSS